MKKLSTYLFLLVFIAASLKTIAQQNIIIGGNMESADEDSWSISALANDPANTSSYEFGYTTDGPVLGDGVGLHYVITNTGVNGAHLMFYQEVTIVHGQRYVADMAVKAVQEMNNSWFEVYLGAEPVEGSDYGADQGTPLGGFKWSGWAAECTDLDLFDGSLHTDGCLVGSQDTILIEGEGESVLYFGFKAGIWATDTEVEFIVDNVTLTNIDAGVSVKTKEPLETNIYPNPTKSQLNIQSSKSFSEVYIANVLGQKVLNVTNASKSIDVSSLNSGIYFLKLTDTNQQVETLKFQKN